MRVMATITVKDLIKSLEKCDPNAIVVAHVEDKEYTFAIEVIEQFSREEIVETAQRECEGEDEIYFNDPHYSKNYRVSEEEWSEGPTSVVYLREKWLREDASSPHVIYMKKGR